LALGGPAHQPGDVDEVHRRRHDRLRMVELDQRVEPRVGNGHDADVRFDGAERVVRDRRPGGRQRVEQGRLADVGQPDDAAGDGDERAGDYKKNARATAVTWMWRNRWNREEFAADLTDRKPAHEKCTLASIFINNFR